jgi:hypothetical protein
MTTQICNHCNIEKPLEAFNWRWKGLGVRQPACRECQKKQKNEWYVRNQPSERERLRQQKADNQSVTKAWVNDYKASHGCIDCGESDPVCLDFDHVKGNKIAAVSQLIANNASLTAVQKEASKCVVRCANCHRKITARRGGW